MKFGSSEKGFIDSFLTNIAVNHVSSILAFKQNRHQPVLGLFGVEIITSDISADDWHGIGLMNRNRNYILKLYHVKVYHSSKTLLDLI